MFGFIPTYNIWGFLIGTIIAFLLTVILAVSFGNFIIKNFNAKYLLRFGGLIFLFFTFNIFLQSSISRNILIKLWKK